MWVHVQTSMRSSDIRAFMFRLSCPNAQTFVRSGPDFRAVISFPCVHLQTFVRSQHFRALMFQLLCGNVQIFVLSQDFCAFIPSRLDFCAFLFRILCVHRHTLVASYSNFYAFIRLSCVHVATFARPPDFRNFRLLWLRIQIFVRSWSWSYLRGFLIRLSCIHIQKFMRSSDFLAFMFNFFLRSPHFCAFMFRLSCVQDQNLNR